MCIRTFDERHGQRFVVLFERQLREQLFGADHAQRRVRRVFALHVVICGKLRLLLQDNRIGNVSTIERQPTICKCAAVSQNETQNKKNAAAAARIKENRLRIPPASPSQQSATQTAAQPATLLHLHVICEAVVFIDIVAAVGRKQISSLVCVRACIIVSMRSLARQSAERRTFAVCLRCANERHIAVSIIDRIHTVRSRRSARRYKNNEVCARMQTNQQLNKQKPN